MSNEAVLLSLTGLLNKLYDVICQTRYSRPSQQQSRAAESARYWVRSHLHK